MRRTCEDLLVDVAGLCVTVREADYIKASLAGWEDDGPCTAIGHARTMTAAGAAFVNGTAAHGEDFDDTFEGGPVHAGAVIVPAVLAACERHNPDGRAALVGIAAGVEIMCRLSLVAPMRAHKAGFHPTAIYGAMGAAAGVGAALGLNKKQIVDALGIVGSMASGIIEYLAEGAWTKRMHAGWSAQSGMRAALLARAGFYGPRTVFEGVHGLFHGFANTLDGNYDEVIGDFGKRWVTETIAFKPYPCGTMAHPYIDCARRLAAKVKAARSRRSSATWARGPCIGCGSRSPPSRSPRTAMPGNSRRLTASRPASCAAMSGSAISPTTPCAIRRWSRWRRRCSFRIDPQNPYPRAFTGHIKATLNDGRVIEERQPHFRGGAKEPLTQADIEEKFVLNCRYGGWDEARTSKAIALLRKLYDGKIDLAPLRG